MVYWSPWSHLLLKDTKKISRWRFWIISVVCSDIRFLSRQRAIFTGGTSRLKRSGPSTTIRKKPCRRLPSSLGWRCRTAGRPGSRTRTRSSRMTSTRSTRSWLGRRARKMGRKMVVTLMMIYLARRNSVAEETVVFRFSCGPACTAMFSWQLYPAAIV